MHITAAQATVVVQERGTQNFQEIIVPIPDYFIIFPEPGMIVTTLPFAASALIITAALLTRLHFTLDLLAGLVLALVLILAANLPPTGCRSVGE